MCRFYLHCIGAVTIIPLGIALVCSGYQLELRTCSNVSGGILEWRISVPGL